MAAARKAEEVSNTSGDKVELLEEPEASHREIHIRLTANAADSRENLYPLRNFLEGNPGICPVYIHVPVSRGISKEKVIRIEDQIDAGISPSIRDLAECVADVWRD